MSIFVYKIEVNDEKRNVVVVAENSTIANAGLKQRFGHVPKSFLCQADEMFQVNGNVVIDGETKIVE